MRKRLLCGMLAALLCIGILYGVATPAAAAENSSDSYTYDAEGKSQATPAPYKMKAVVWGAEAFGGVALKNPQDFFVDEKDDYTIEWVIPNAQKNEMEPILLTLHPHKQSHELQSHTGEEFGYVLKGNITLVRGNKRYKLKAKETFYVNGRTGHYLYNHGNNDAVVLWITTPPMF